MVQTMGKGLYSMSTVIQGEKLGQFLENEFPSMENLKVTTCRCYPLISSDAFRHAWMIQCTSFAGRQASPACNSRKCCVDQSNEQQAPFLLLALRRWFGLPLCSWLFHVLLQQQVRLAGLDSESSSGRGLEIWSSL